MLMRGERERERRYTDFNSLFILTTTTTTTSKKAGSRKINNFFEEVNAKLLKKEGELQA